MNGEDVLDETRTFNEQLQQVLAGLPRVETLPAEKTRRLRREGRGVFPPLVFSERAREVAIGEHVSVRVIEPDGARGAYLHVHGGGWTLGSSDGQDPWLEELAERTGMTMVSVGYRLAPEHPYPAAVDDCEAAARWFLDAYDGRRVIGGESAGAHLAVLTLVRLRDAGAAQFDGANLVFGAYDLTGTPSRQLWGERDLILSSPLMDWFADNFLGDMPLARRRDPEVSPLFADLRSLPPALFTCGTLDPLLDDSLFMEARWRSAGNAATLSLWAEAVHAFTAFPLEIAGRSRAEQAAFVGGN